MEMDCKLLFTVLTFTICLSSFAQTIPARTNQAGLSDSALVAIRDGFDPRVADLFDAQKGRLLSDMGRSGWNAAQRYAYPRIEYATVNLRQGQAIDAANSALVEYGDYFVNNPAQVLHRDHFHWHSEMALRLIEMFGHNGTQTPGLLKPETEDKILEAVWLYCKRRQEDQKPVNTKAEADTEESNTWYIYESENHHSQSFCTQWHYAKLAKDRPGFEDRKYDDGKNALEHYNAWNKYLKMYFTERAKKGIYIETMSRDYNQKSLKGIFNVYDFAMDPELKQKAGFYLDLYFTYWGEEQIDGVAGGGKSRLYSDTSPGTSEYGYLFFGIGDKPRFGSTLLSAMTTSYRPPLVVVDIVCDRQGRGNYEVRQRPLGLAENGFYEPPIYHMRTDFGGILRYSYCTPDFVMGTAIFEARPQSDWALISSQNQSHGVIFAGDKNAGILPQCEKTGNNRSYNSQWSVQRKGTLICQKLETNQRAGRTKVWFSSAGLSKPMEEDNWIFSESQGAYAAVHVVDGGYAWEDGGPRAEGKWLVCDNEYSPVILEVDRKSDYKSFEAFRAKVTGNALSFENTILHYTGIYGDAFTFYADYSQSPQINGTPVDYAPSTAYDSPFLKADWNSGVVHIQKGSRSLVLDFTHETTVYDAMTEGRERLTSKAPAEPNLTGAKVSENKTSNHRLLPGKGLAQHDFLYAGESKSRRAFIVRNGKIVWSYDDPQGRGEISDAILLSNGNVLLAHQYAVKLISPENKVLWNLDAPPNSEIHTAMPIGLDHVLYVQNSDPAWVRVVNLATDRVVKEFQIPAGNPKNIHGHYRHARITPAGTLVVAHMDMNRVCEYSADGKEIWSYAVANPWGVTPLKNGNILITCRTDVREVTRSGETVATFLPSDSPDYKLTSLQQAWRLPNGNTLVNTWFNEWSNTKVDRTNPPVQAVEFTPDKEVVWVLRSWDNPDLGPSTTIQILDEPDWLEHVTFGNIK